MLWYGIVIAHYILPRSIPFSPSLLRKFQQPSAQKRRDAQSNDCIYAFFSKMNNCCTNYSQKYCNRVWQSIAYSPFSPSLMHWFRPQCTLVHRKRGTHRATDFSAPSFFLTFGQSMGGSREGEAHKSKMISHPFSSRGLASNRQTGNIACYIQHCWQ